VYELMIIGGGPAGITAGVYAARKKLKTLLVSGDIGGQINTSSPSLPAVIGGRSDIFQSLGF